MATNPNNAVGTNGAFGGRTSVNAFNDVLSIFNGRGIVQGWDMAPNEGMIINIGGDGTTRDVAVAEDNIGNKTTINNISEEPIALTIPAAPAASSRIDAVVAYVDNPAQGSATETDNPAACGLIVVEGTVTTTPTAPDEEAIRTAITADGGAGTVAYYVVLGTVTVASGTTDISANMLTKGGYAAVKSDNVDLATTAGYTIVRNVSESGALATISYRETSGIVELRIQNADSKTISIPTGITVLASGVPIPSTPFYTNLSTKNGVSVLADVRNGNVSVWNTTGAAISTSVLVGRAVYLKG